MSIFRLVRSENFDSQTDFLSLEEIRRWIKAICLTTEDRAVFTPDKIVEDKRVSARIAQNKNTDLTIKESSDNVQTRVATVINYESKDDAEKAVNPLSQVSIIEFAYIDKATAAARLVRVKMQEILVEGSEKTHLTLFFSRSIFDPNAGKPHATRFTTLKIRDIDHPESYLFSKHDVDASIDDCGRSVTFDLPREHLKRQMLVGATNIKSLLRALLPESVNETSLRDHIPAPIEKIGPQLTPLELLRLKVVDYLQRTYGFVDCNPRSPGNDAKGVTVLSTVSGEVEISIHQSPTQTGAEINIDVLVPANLSSQGSFRQVTCAGKRFLFVPAKMTLTEDSQVVDICSTIKARVDEGVAIINGRFDLLLPIHQQSDRAASKQVEIVLPKPRSKKPGYVTRVRAKKPKVAK